MMPPEIRERLVDEISTTLGLQLDAESTMEANPEDISEQFFSRLGSVNRISIGVQSFKPRFLEALDRKTSREAVLSALHHLKHFGNWSLDLIFGIPGQSTNDMVEDIEEAVGFRPKHISAYTLTLKPGHPLFDRLPDADYTGDMYEMLVKTLVKYGYHRYEISNFALPGYECRHNTLYWDGGDFLGLGPSASSRLFDGNFHHRKQVADFERYLAQKSIREIAFVATTTEQTRLEAVFLELRKSSGIWLNQFVSRYGYSPLESPKYQIFKDAGFVEFDGDRLTLTPKGLLLADSITPELYY